MKMKTIELSMEDISIIMDALTFYANKRDASNKPGIKKENTEKIRNVKERLK